MLFNYVQKYRAKNTLSVPHCKANKHKLQISFILLCKMEREYFVQVFDPSKETVRITNYIRTIKT